MSKLSKWVCVAMIGVMALAAGCRTAKPPTGAGLDDSIPPFERMPDRSQIFESGQRVNVTFDTVRFDYDSFKIKQTEVAKIEAVAVYMSQNRDVVCILEGHCDERGSNEYNLSLGEQRGQAVRQQMIGLGVANDRLQTRSYGEERPADPGHNEAAWSQNRRVEFVLLK